MACHFVYNIYNVISGPQGWVNPSAPPLPTDQYPNLPPPSYDYAVDTDEGTFVNIQFIGDITDWDVTSIIIHF